MGACPFPALPPPPPEMGGGAEYPAAGAMEAFARPTRLSTLGIALSRARTVAAREKVPAVMLAPSPSLPSVSLPVNAADRKSVV